MPSMRQLVTCNKLHVGLNSSSEYGQLSLSFYEVLLTSFRFPEREDVKVIFCDHFE